MLIESEVEALAGIIAYDDAPNEGHRNRAREAIAKLDAMRNNKARARLIYTAIAVAMSEVGTAAVIAGDPRGIVNFDPWPEMDELLAALDEARPGWREHVVAAVVRAQFGLRNIRKAA